MPGLPLVAAMRPGEEAGAATERERLPGLAAAGLLREMDVSKTTVALTASGHIKPGPPADAGSQLFRRIYWAGMFIRKPY